MGKLKTHKATAKRYKVTGTGKIIRRKAGQDHFNARDTGKTGRYKKSVLVASQTLRKVMQKNLPNL